MNTRPFSNILRVFLLAVGCMPSFALGDSTQPMRFRLASTDSPPHIDGRLDDAAWSRALQVDTFHSLRGQDDAATPATTAWLTYDDTAMFLAFQCAEPRMDRLRTHTTAHDGPAWQDDCVELFLSPPAETAGYAHVTINAAGVVRDAWRSASGEEDLGWTSDAAVATHRRDDGWTVEARLPFDRLRLIGQGDWSFQLARTRPGAMQHLTMLNVNMVSFHMPQHFAALAGLRLADRPIRVLEASLGEQLAGVNVARMAVVNDTNEAQTFVAAVQYEGDDHPVAHLRDYLEPGINRTVELPWDLDAGWRGRVWLAVKSGDRLMGGIDYPVDTPAVLADQGMRALVYEPNEAVSLSVPVALAAPSRVAAQLDWRLLDDAGGMKSEGTVAVGGTTVDVPLRPQQSGRHELQLTLRWGNDASERLVAPLYLVVSPFAECGDAIRTIGR